MKHQGTYLIYILLCLLTLCVSTRTEAQESQRLTGTVIGTEWSVDYNTGSYSTTVNTRDMAFDDNPDTYFASYYRSNTWVGLDLGTPHVITQVAWMPRSEGELGKQRVCLALFEGANQPDFSDALPLYLVDHNGTTYRKEYGDVTVSRGFRYVRYVGPNDARCNVAEVNFFGYEGEGDSTQYYQVTNIPTISIHTKDGIEPYDKENEIECQVAITYDGGTRIQEYPMLIRLRGNASKDFPKKPYRIKFNDGKKHHMLHDSELESPAKAKKWTLINNYGDKTLMRNILAFDISRRLGMDYTPYCQPVDVIVNGEYKGCYQLCDQIEIGKHRVEITDMHNTDNSGSALTGGYLMEIDAYYSDEPVYFKTSSYSNPVVIKSPSSDSITTEQRNYIGGYFNLMESALAGSNYTSATRGYRSKLDVESFLKHFLVGEFSGNTDTYWSTYVTKDRDQDLMKIGPVWDFDLAFENDGRTYPINDLSNYIYATKGSYAGGMRTFVNRILSDQNTKDELQAMWIDARRHRGIDEETLLAYVDSIASVLDASQQLNFRRWDILNSYVHQNPRVYGSYEGEVQNVKDYIANRIKWFDKRLGYDASTDEIVAPQEATTLSGLFDMSGRRIPEGETLRPGIYIRNGHKVLIK